MGQTEKDDGSPREGMPEMKGLKELKLLVKQLIEKNMAGHIFVDIPSCHISFRNVV